VPPTLLIHARDDTVDPVHYSLVYERELKRAGVDVTLMLYDTGGHAFGVRKQGKATDRWTADALRWLGKIGML
jgi:acetyl esterase/lipase